MAGLLPATKPRRVSAPPYELTEKARADDRHRWVDPCRSLVMRLFWLCLDDLV